MWYRKYELQSVSGIAAWFKLIGSNLNTTALPKNNLTGILEFFRYQILDTHENSH